MPESVLPSTSTDPSARSSLILLLAGVSDTNESLTFAGVAGALPSQSFVSTLASTMFATLDDPLAESFPAMIERGVTVTVTIASSQLDGVAISQIP